MSFVVVIPTKYPDIIAPLLASIKTFEPDPPRILIINDGNTEGYGYEVIPYEFPDFVFSRSVNLGIKAAGTDDVILCNDDIVLLEPNTFQRLHDAAYSAPRIGLISPLIKGCAGNEYQRWHGHEDRWKGLPPIISIQGVAPVCFPLVYIKRELFDRAGLMDESITGYGYDDDSMCLRARKAGFLTAITRNIVVQHGDGGPELGEGRGKTWSLSFERRKREHHRG